MPHIKVALITGSARRIGAGIARHLHAAGYRVALHAHTSQTELRALALELENARADSTLTLQADLRDTAQLPGLVTQCVQRFGRLDALVNNASNFYPTPLHEATPAQWDDLFAVNARAPLFLAQAATEQLRQHGGAIVNLTDLHAEQPLRAHPLYGAAKAALAMLTRSLALELAPQVRVNAIAPGAILWPDAGKDPAAQQALLARTPLARTGDIADIAEAVRWLLDDAHFVTGQTLRVDGGRGLS
ncbi:pteridine reductase [Xanthomonas albilineans]|uniref:Putative pteridin reductase protein n=1 Tax=Xanthomonas albilineans (strain GPE PC73 / CFBP 7063) TaxID=380358 RepID=D2UC60_XANAP|nr:pteridine reductase [Xanthomonas albilineans]PPU93311.1 pteridine reductase [Xanthomonas albilineans]QHQ27567.1 putative pteridin reductase protein [Xanthomonas albilineans]CBA15351.1 putative pteridin reductase protein [Xanthomonas albilineans GPE PC73]